MRTESSLPTWGNRGLTRGGLTQGHMAKTEQTPDSQAWASLCPLLLVYTHCTPNAHTTHYTHRRAACYICHTYNTHTSTPHTHRIHTLHITQEMLSKLRYTNPCRQTRFHRPADQLTCAYTCLEGSMQTCVRHAPEDLHTLTHADVVMCSQVVTHVKI